jgi:hypothetical protein
MNDPIVDEVRRVRDAHAARFNYDLDAIFRNIKEREKESGHNFVAGVARPTMPNQPPAAAIPVSETSTVEAVPAAEPLATGNRGEVNPHSTHSSNQ